MNQVYLEIPYEDKEKYAKIIKELRKGSVAESEKLIHLTDTIQFIFYYDLSFMESEKEGVFVIPKRIENLEKQVTDLFQRTSELEAKNDFEEEAKKDFEESVKKSVENDFGIQTEEKIKRNIHNRKKYYKLHKALAENDKELKEEIISRNWEKLECNELCLEMNLRHLFEEHGCDVGEIDVDHEINIYSVHDLEDLVYVVHCMEEIGEEYTIQPGDDGFKIRIDLTEDINGN